MNSNSLRQVMTMEEVEERIGDLVSSEARWHHLALRRKRQLMELTVISVIGNFILVLFAAWRIGVFN